MCIFHIFFSSWKIKRKCVGLSFNPQIAISGSKGTDAEGMLRGVLGVTTTAACVTVAGDTSWGPAAILFLPTTAILGQGGEHWTRETNNWSCLAFSHWQPSALRREPEGQGAPWAGGCWGVVIWGGWWCSMWEACMSQWQTGCNWLSVCHHSLFGRLGSPPLGKPSMVVHVCEDAKMADVVTVWATWAAL